MDNEVAERFQIDNDSKAEWALSKIKEAEEERDRLLALIAAKRDELEAAEDKVEDDYLRDTEWLRYQLQMYMGTVKCKSTKTQDTYQLLSGKLVRKHAGTEFAVDRPKLVEWLLANDRKDLVKVSMTPVWADVKKQISGDPETGVCVFADTGEQIDGVTAVQTEETFNIKFN